MEDMSKCIRCGKCCKTWTILTATKEDINKWKNSDMKDYVVNGKMWFDPKTKQRLRICPLLIDNKCSIYPKNGEIDMRPNICSRYPMDKPCLNSTMEIPMDCGNGNKLNISFFKRNESGD